jgi:membrane associated rhomboid family serine protease
MFTASSIMAIIIFAATVGISLYALYRDHSLFNKFMLHPYSMLREKKYYQVITSGLIHADLNHLLANMFTFYFFAFRLEVYTGSLKFLIIYFGSMIIADLTCIAKNKNNYGYRSLGASGAISGVLFSIILYDPTATLRLLLLPIPMPAWVFAILYLVYCHFSAKRQGDNINHEAHLWGAAGGAGLTMLMDPGIIFRFFNQLF